MRALIAGIILTLCSTAALADWREAVDGIRVEVALPSELPSGSPCKLDRRALHSAIELVFRQSGIAVVGEQDAGIILDEEGNARVISEASKEAMSHKEYTSHEWLAPHRFTVWLSGSETNTAQCVMGMTINISRLEFFDTGTRWVMRHALYQTQPGHALSSFATNQRNITELAVRTATDLANGILAARQAE